MDAQYGVQTATIIDTWAQICRPSPRLHNHHVKHKVTENSYKSSSPVNIYICLLYHWICQRTFTYVSILANLIATAINLPLETVAEQREISYSAGKCRGHMWRNVR